MYRNDVENFVRAKFKQEDVGKNGDKTDTGNILHSSLDVHDGKPRLHRERCWALLGTPHWAK